MIAIIIEYYKQGFAQCFDENSDKEFHLKMNFGDIARRKMVDEERLV